MQFNNKLAAASAIAAMCIGTYFLSSAQSAMPVGSTSLPLFAVGAANPFVNGFAQGAAWGPGVVDSTANLAGPGPWGILNSGPSTVNTKISVQNVGERTAEFYRSSDGGIFQSIAGGQSAAFTAILPVNDALVVRFVGGGTEGKVVWVAR